MNLHENMVVAERYRLSRMIGRGGMGSVWLAQHLGLDTPCAIKFIEGELANAPEAHARFDREAKAAAKLRSPHVVQIFDNGVWQGIPYIAMELLEGEDLGHKLSRVGGRLAPAEVYVIIQQVCRALAKAHGAGIVHRDLKPDNIFIVEDDDREIVKILDFGVAKSTGMGIEGSNTKTGAMLGTPYYMSPEQAQGIKSVDARSDLWSLAVIVFQCITGRLPFESEALGDLLVKIIVQPIPAPSSYFPGVPVGFDAWWRKASERNVDARFASAKEFVDALGVALGQSGVTELDSGRVPRIGGATAVMPGGIGGAAHAGAMNTPRPIYPSDPGAAPSHGASGDLSSSGASMHASAPGFGSHPGTDVNMARSSPGATSYAGLETPVKSGPPVKIILAALGGLALVGTIAIAVSLAGGKPASASDPPSASASASTAPPPEPVASAEPPPVEAPSAAAAVEPTPSAEPVAAKTPAKAPTTEKTTTKTSATKTAPTTKPAAGAKKAVDFGF